MQLGMVGLGRMGANMVRRLVRDGHDLVYTHATFITVCALPAADRPVHSDPVFNICGFEALFFQSLGWDIDRLLAVAAQLACQALRNDEADRRRDGVGLDAHIDQSSERLRRIVGVQSREHQVPGLRRLDGDLCGFQVADFADHDDIRVLS